MSGDNVSERVAFVNHIIPGEWEPSRRRPVSQKQVCHHPRSVLKLGHVRWRTLAIWTYDISSQKVGSGKHNTICMESTRAAAVVIDRNNVHPSQLTGARRNDFR